eukprot:scaffold23191_cov113-Skeletonema_marinoi.AAC.1
MGRAAWSRFALLRGGKSGTATRALGAVSAISFGWKVLHIIDMVPTYHHGAVQPVSMPSGESVLC